MAVLACPLQHDARPPNVGARVRLEALVANLLRHVDRDVNGQQLMCERTAIQGRFGAAVDL